MPLLAHSARPKKGIPAQQYREHVGAVESLAEAVAQAAARYWTGDRDWFINVTAKAAHWHDFGKVDPKNQEVLEGSSNTALPVGHEHAGVRHLMGLGLGEAAALVYSHHKGLPSLMPELMKFKTVAFCDPGDSVKDDLAVQRAEALMDSYLRVHRECIIDDRPLPQDPSWRKRAKQWTGLTWRFGLSCLVDADHSDTARHYGQEVLSKPVQTRWGERLLALDAYVDGLFRDSERNRLRRAVYEACRSRAGNEKVYACDSGVGTGKTTAVMAHLLRIAEERCLRHIFVVLPYTNIIDQALKVYNKALVLTGEQPDRVVGAHHHQAEYQSPELRLLATLWDCPITITTAVQFFETIASAKPSKLRKLHELPGSAIFIDEAHAAIPAHFWPQTWLWLQELTRDWGCHVVLASGSLVKFWEHKDFVNPPLTIPDLLTDGLQASAHRADAARVSYELIPDRIDTTKLLHFIDARPNGPWLVIVNTVLSAATIAKSFRDSGRDVLHLSTALAPVDRDAILEKVKKRLQDKNDKNWILVATSCIEAGADVSFGSAIRELAATSSMVQIGGRVNRHGEANANESVVWVVRFDDSALTNNPAMKTPGIVLEDLFAGGLVNAMDASALCDEALRRELNKAGPDDLSAIRAAEEKKDFEAVAKLYRVIEDETVTVLVKPMLGRFESGESLKPIDLVRGSVKIRRRALAKLSVRSVRGSEELYAWTLNYDPGFLGYMDGVLQAQGAAAGDFLHA
ncbi:MAG TPA: DEAD/DEAH box helicase family protein [Bryobacteraceae bacterium]|jgi:CRISPR-associated endonuclease/helicase Cas3|nr:DEAD/DEAH box helicase family protein [Bryobacteraceae bacterium]